MPARTPIVRGRPTTTSARVQLPQAVKRLSSLRTSKTFVPNSSMLYFGQSRPANRSTVVEARILPWKTLGLQYPAGVNAPAAAQNAVTSVWSPDSWIWLRIDDGAEPW